MKTNINNFNRNSVAVDEFFNNALFNKKKVIIPQKILLEKKEISLLLQIFQIFFLRLSEFGLFRLGKNLKNPEELI